MKKLDFYDQLATRTKLTHLIQTTIWAINDMSYESEVLEPYAFKKMDQLLEEIEEVKQFWLAKKREHAVKDMVTAMDEVGV
jgi:hypothetical protein